MPLILHALVLLFAGGSLLAQEPPSINGETTTALAAARAAASTAELEAARAELLNLSRRYPRSLHPRLVDRSRALVEAAALGRHLGSSNAAAGELLQVLEREAPSEWTPRAHLELADLVLAGGNWRLAAEHLRLARAGALELADPNRADSADNPFTIDVAQIALERMTRIHRLILRPLTGRSPWTKTRIHLSGDYLPEQLKLKKPRTVAASTRGDLLVSDNDRVVLLDREGKTVTTRELRGVVGASLVPAGPMGGLQALVATPNNVVPLEAGSSYSFVRPSGGKLDQIAAVHRGFFGDWTVLSRRMDVVLRYRADGRLLDFSPSTLTQPIDMATGPMDTVHVLDGGSRSSPPVLLTFDGNWQVLQTLSGNWERPLSLAVDPFGNSYVLDGRTRRILVYSQDGAEIGALGPYLPGGIELRAPTDIAVDGMGRVFIAEGRMETVLVVE